MDDSNTDSRLNSESFECPHCSVLALQTWVDTNMENDHLQYRNTNVNFQGEKDHLYVSFCYSCNKYSIWILNNLSYGKWNSGELIYPRTTSAPPPHDKMPQKAKELYEETLDIHNGSSRAAATLLRSAFEEILKDQGIYDNNLHKSIELLVEKGLPKTVKQAMHTVRIIGNRNVHNMQEIDLGGKDEIETVNMLFNLLNFIVEKIIEEPARIEGDFLNLSPDKNSEV